MPVINSSPIDGQTLYSPNTYFLEKSRQKNYKHATYVGPTHLPPESTLDELPPGPPGPPGRIIDDLSVSTRKTIVSEFDIQTRA